MARPTKQGIDYFPLDTVFDGKVELFILDNGPASLSVLITVWQMIYGNEGYYIQYSNDLFLLIKRRLMMDELDIQKIIEAAVKREIFSSDQYSTNKILTSPLIQRSYFIAARKKKVVYVVKNYLCNGVSDGGNCTVEWVDTAGNATKEKEEVKGNDIPEKISIDFSSTEDQPLSETEAIEIAKFMADTILERDPQYRFLLNGKREKTIRQWTKDIEKLNRLDDRSWEQIWQVVRWCMGDDFWNKNILSGEKLRKQFGQLVLKMPKDDSNPKIDCTNCTYNQSESCRNLSQEDFDPSKCDSYRSIGGAK